MVTAGSLFDYLSANLGEDLPRNADFTADIPLGVTRRLEGESAYVMGTALLAAAEALVPAGADGERSAHRTALLDLAAEQFARVSEQAADLAARAVLRKAQTDVLRNRDPEIAQAQLDGLVARLGMQPAEAEELKQLLQSGDAQAPRTLRHLRDRLQAGEPFYALILDTVDIPAVKRSADPGAALWKKVLDELPGRRAIETGVIPIDSIDFARPPALPATVRETVNQWRATLKQAEPARLVVVYTGIATTSGLQRSGLSEGSPAESERQERILPFGRAEIELVIADWPGPVTVAYLGPFGGALLSGPPAGRDVSLLLAAREPNGMTFLGAMGAASNAALLARALQEGAEKVEEFPPLAEFNRQMEAGAKPFVPGTPLWIPRWGQPLVGSAAQDQLAPLKHFMLHAAAGCIVDSLQTCDGKRGKPDPFELLATAARSDLHNEHATAVNGYAQAARELRSAAAAASDLRGAAATRKALESLASTIERRTKGEERRRARRVVVLPVGVEDYISPLVPDLPGTSKDLTAYAGALTKAFHNVTLVVRNPRMIVKTDDLTGALRQ
jgi:hypothetical protein